MKRVERGWRVEHRLSRQMLRVIQLIQLLGGMKRGQKWDIPLSLRPK